MRACIHRGAKQIGGTCIEIESKGKRLLLDIGLPLDEELDAVNLPKVEGLRQPDKSLLGILITHAHLDHYGLTSKIEPDVPILIGLDAEKIIRASAFFFPANFKLNNTRTINDRVPVQLGPFKITPYLIDHSAYDAYAFLIEANSKKLFYSGDFRFHGRKGKLLDRLIQNPPKNILITTKVQLHFF